MGTHPPSWRPHRRSAWRGATAACALLALAGTAKAATDKTPPVTPAELSAHIKILASDDFEGRKPGTPGGEKAVAYIAEQFKKVGLKPGVGDRWFQDVPLTEITSKVDGPLTFSVGDKTLTAQDFTQAVLWTPQRTAHAVVKDSELVFVGYGITAPQQGWDDYAGVDVRGKTVVILVNDPGFATKDPALFGGGAMTWYGRWPYKFEEAARHGAAAALIIHETEAAGYGWGVVANSNTTPKLTIMPADGGKDRSALDGWIQLDVAKELFGAAGLDLAALKQAAAQRGFKAVPLNARFSASVTPSIRDVVSRNVVGVIPGAKHPDEAVLISAHWDHLGVGPDVNGDKIYNGAVDNASGVAGMIELARRYKQGAAPDRSILFVAYTAEEQGLLGSEYYATHPLVPAAKTVAGFNMDMLSVVGRTRDLVLVGGGKTDLEDTLRTWATGHHMVVNPEPFPERGYYYRSDHFNLAKVGIPVLYAHGGIDSIEHGAEWGKAKEDEFTRLHYHQPSDEWSPTMDLTGGAEEVNMIYDLSHALAFGTAWPKWYDKSEFKVIRDKSQAP